MESGYQPLTTREVLVTQLRIPCPPVAPVAIAGLLLTARRFLDDYDLPRPTAAAVFASTGAGKSRAYEVADQILDLLPALVRPPGRPAAPPPVPPSRTDVELIAREVLDYVIAHPGCVTGDKRRCYSDGYRHLVLELRERHASMAAPVFADAVRVPDKTLAAWLAAAAGAEPPPTPPPEPPPDAKNPRIQTILAAWYTWQGSFTAFCDYVARELRIPYGRTFLSTVLALHGVRFVRRRPGRSPDELVDTRHRRLDKAAPPTTAPRLRPARRAHGGRSMQQPA